MDEASHPKDLILERNLERYALYDPVLAVFLESVDCSEYQWCYTHLGEINLSRTVDKTVLYYHEMSGAAAEAKKWVKNLPLKDHHCIFLYGIGLGYYYDQMKPWLRAHPNNRLIIIEDELPVIRKFFETERASEVLQDPQVVFEYFDSRGPEPIKSFFDRFRTIMKGYGREGLFLTSSYLYYQIKENLCLEIRNAIFSYTNWVVMSMNEALLDRAMIFENYYSNTLRQYGSYDAHALKNRFKDIPALICGAGPSIIKDIDFIRSIQDKAMIIASGTGMNVLNHYGIIPHFGTGLDPSKSQGTRIRTNFAYEVPVFYRRRFHADSFRLIHAPKLMVQKSGSHVVSDWFDKQLGMESDYVPESGVSSTNFAMEFAVLLGCNPIILAGFDLAYTDASRYPPIIAEHPIDPKTAKDEIKAKSDAPIIGWNIKGEKVFTKLDWIEEAGIVYAFVNAHPETKVINTTLEGLAFRAVEYVELSSLKERYFDRSLDLSNWIHAEIQNALLRAPKEKYPEILKRWKASVHRCIEIYGEIQAEIKALWERCAEGKRLPVPPYSGRLALLQSDLWDEPAYQYLVTDVSSTIDDLAIAEKMEFKKMQSDLSDVERDLKQLEIDLNYIAFFEETVQFHEHLLNRVIEDYEHDEVALSEKAETVPSGTPPANGERDCYAAENGKLTIRDRSLHLDIEAEFCPQLLPEAARKPLKKGEQLSDTYLTFQGKLEGQYQKFYENGVLFADMYYQRDRLHGPVTYFHASGQVLAKSWFVEGVQQGKNWQYYPSGALYALKMYKEGLAEGLHQYYYENGTLKSALTFSKGRYDGSVTLYYSNGKKKRELHFKEGKLHGVERYWNPSGILIWEVLYEEGKPSGEANLWHPNGQLARSYVYFEDHKRYNLKEWNSEGSLVYEENNMTLDMQETENKKIADLKKAIALFYKDIHQLEKMTKYEKQQLFY